MNVKFSKRTQRKLAILILTLAGTASAASAGVWWMNHAPPDTTIEAESFENHHLALYWKLTFSAQDEDGRVTVGLAGWRPEVQVLSGHRGFNTNSGPEQTETDSPSCTSQCWQGYAFIEAESEPGLTKLSPYTRWVAWYLYPTMQKDGETVVTFRAHMPSDGKDCRNSPSCDQVKQWTPYGKWTLITTPATLVYTSTIWGSTYDYIQSDPERVVFTVTKP